MAAKWDLLSGTTMALTVGLAAGLLAVVGVAAMPAADDNPGGETHQSMPASQPTSTPQPTPTPSHGREKGYPSGHPDRDSDQEPEAPQVSPAEPAEPEPEQPQADTDTDSDTGTGTGIGSENETGSAPDVEHGIWVYPVKPGDTLGEISCLTGISVWRLAYVNDIADPDLIHAGTFLVIPAA